jgi:hypothetical protein
MDFSELFKCQECYVWYQAKWEQFPEPAPGTFNCMDCGMLVHSWSGIDRYSGWRRVRSPTACA